MTKIYSVCEVCKTQFYRAPAFHRHAAKRGGSIRFCSKACTITAKRSGLIAGKPIKGENLTCEVCKSSFYRPQSMIAAGKTRFCSEPCRMKGYELGLIDRTGPRPNRLLGAEITCVICQKTVYRKKSMIDRNIDKTCGDKNCVSAYSRSLWDLPPRDKSLDDKPKHIRKYRKDNFNALQRKTWLDDKCAMCGSTKNLSLDHIVAVCNGGTATRENAQTLCQPCNNWKATNVDRLVKQTRKGAFNG